MPEIVQGEIPVDRQTAPSSARSVWQELKSAIQGTGADYTQIAIGRAGFLLAVPMILELVRESTFWGVGVYFGGRLGPAGVATVGRTETYLFLLYSIGIGLAMAVTAIVARRIGEKDKDQAGITAVQSIFLAVLVSIPFALIGIFFARDLLAVM